MPLIPYAFPQLVPHRTLYSYLSICITCYHMLRVLEVYVKFLILNCTFLEDKTCVLLSHPLLLPTFPINSVLHISRAQRLNFDFL